MTETQKRRRVFPGAWIVVAFIALGLATGCGRSQDDPGPDADHEGHDHEAGDHEGHDHGEAPHGGHLIVLGAETAHLEVVHDDDAGVLTVYVLNADMTPNAIETAPLLNLKFASGPKQLKGTSAQAGASSEWRFEDAVLKEEPESGRFRVVVGETVYTPAFEHEHEEHGDHEGDDHDGDDHEEAGHDGH